MTKHRVIYYNTFFFRTRVIRYISLASTEVLMSLWDTFSQARCSQAVLDFPTQHLRCRAAPPVEENCEREGSEADLGEIEE